jgi:signal transduction histidine kinase
MRYQTRREAELARKVNELETRNAELSARNAELEGCVDRRSNDSTLADEAVAALESGRRRPARANGLVQERAREVEAANRSRQDILAVMSHELRTPLNAIGGYAEIMELGLNGPVTEAQLASLARIRRNQEYLLSLIADVLDFANEESGVVEVRMADVNVVEVVRSVRERVEPQMMAKGLRYRCEVPDVGVRVRGDGKRVQQILVNLLGNAVKFTARQGEVRLSCEADEERVLIRVADTGYGIPAAELDRVFEPYTQAHGKISRREGGVGLGLSISRQLARRMGGDLTVESAPGKGSIFTLALVRGYRATEETLFPSETAGILPDSADDGPRIGSGSALQDSAIAS